MSKQNGVQTVEVVTGARPRVVARITFREWQEFGGLRTTDKLVQQAPDRITLIREARLLIVSDSEVAVVL